MVIDDDTDLLESLSLMFASENIEARMFSDCNNLIEEICEFRPDLILLDFLLPGMDGKEICRKLKQDTDTRHIPVVLMSGYPGAEQGAKECGAVEFLPKPFRIEQILELIRRHVEMILVYFYAWMGGSNSMFNPIT